MESTSLLSTQDLQLETSANTASSEKPTSPSSENPSLQKKRKLSETSSKSAVDVEIETEEMNSLASVSFILAENQKLRERNTFLSAKVAHLEAQLTSVAQTAGGLVDGVLNAEKKKEKRVINPLLRWVVGVSKKLASLGRLFKYQVDDAGVQVKGTWKWISPSVKLEDIADHCCGKKERNGRAFAWSCWKLKEDASIVSGSYEEIEIGEEKKDEVMEE